MGTARSNRSEPIMITRPVPAARIAGSTACTSSVGLFTKNSSWAR